MYISNLLSLEDESKRLPQNIGNQLLIYAV
jgi:hypothetical protein